MKKFIIYGTLKTEYFIEIEAETKKEAIKLAESKTLLEFEEVHREPDFNLTHLSLAI